MVTLLTSTGHGEGNASRVPGSNACNFTKTSVGLSRQTGDSPTTDDTFVSVTTGSSTDIQDLPFTEHLGDIYFLLEQTTGKVNLRTSITTVNLNLHKVGHLLSELHLADLGVSQYTHNLAVLLDAIELGLNILRLLSGFHGILGERLLLGAVPVLVEAASHVIRQVIGPDSGQTTQSVGGGYVSHNSDHNHGWGFYNRYSLHRLSLMQLRTRSLDLSDNMTHTCLVTHECCQVGGERLIILRE
mmetsp:Transcript_22310/g.37324  ORF Transcript_22310/g.37324 Transcript_22310/m.37324 type:complete len:243 (+) Transcript_22310:1574-2302(+)